MFQKAMKDLRGDAVIARYGCIRAVDDLYFDCDCWEVRYLSVGMSVEAEEGAAGGVADLVVDDELVPLDWVGPMDRASGALYLHRTREELRSSPSL